MILPSAIISAIPFLEYAQLPVSCTTPFLSLQAPFDRGSKFPLLVTKSFFNMANCCVTPSGLSHTSVNINAFSSPFLIPSSIACATICCVSLSNRFISISPFVSFSIPLRLPLMTASDEVWCCYEDKCCTALTEKP